MGSCLSRQQKEVRIQQLLLMKGMEQEQAKGEECTICMQRQSKASINGCAHHFCIRCIRRWSKTKNTCPLCRERYHEIRYRNKAIPVSQPSTLHRPVRAPVLPAGQQQRRIVYVPFFIYPQQHCLVYQAPSYYLLPPAVEESAGGYSLSLPGPSFFVPTL